MGQAYLQHVIHNTIHHLALERLEHNRPVPRHELRLARSRQYHPLPYIQHAHNSDNIPKLSRTCPFDVGVELRLEVLEHARPEVGRVKEDGVRELLLCWPSAINIPWSIAMESSTDYEEHSDELLSAHP